VPVQTIIDERKIRCSGTSNEVREGCRVFGTAHFKAESDSPDNNDKISKIIEIVKPYVFSECENINCFGEGAFCLDDDDNLLEMAKEIIKLFETDDSNKKESIKSAIFSAKSFLNNALTELEHD